MDCNRPDPCSRSGRGLVLGCLDPAFISQSNLGTPLPLFVYLLALPPPCLFIYLFPSSYSLLLFHSSTSTTQKHLQLIFSLKIPTANCKKKLRFFYTNSVAVDVCYVHDCLHFTLWLLTLFSQVQRLRMLFCRAHTHQNEKSNAKRTYCWG